MEELVILSDLWGFTSSDGYIPYQQILTPRYKITFLDSCVLGQVECSSDDEKQIHAQFVSFGIDKAASQLLTHISKPKIYIGCSVGGTILWRAALKGLPIHRLITISASRIRLEKTKPSCPLRMYYGKKDKYIPNNVWFDQMAIYDPVFLEGSHDIYK